MATSPADSDEVIALQALLEERYSCRAFLPTPLDPVELTTLFRMAQRTASWCNAQPWQVVVTSGAATVRFSHALLEAADSAEPRFDIPPPESYDGVYRDRRRASGLALYEAVGVQRADLAGRERQQRENFRFFGAPHVAVITTARALGPYGYVDCGGYVSTLLLAAQSLGLAAIPQAAIAMYSDAVRAHFGLKPDRVVVCAVSVGHADRSHPANKYRTAREEVAGAVEFRNE